ncbi:MAG TPA: cell envelope integrity protein TolA, partial [Steroidobacteraceae bacterium]|nr:cell envelope integrity protein TolA [Steroidobacteraceae bacterium]
AKQRKDSEAELKRRLAEEERRNAAENSGQLAQYVAQIQARIQRAWIRPPSARAGLTCIVNVTQVPGGQVVGVKVGECNGDEAVRQSIEDAVIRASPLPEPPDPSLFERNLRLEFKPGDLN